MIPDLVLRALQILRDNGQSAWIVGGAARDLWAGRAVKDFDIVLGDDGIKWARRLSKVFDGSFVLLDEVRQVGRVVFEDAGKMQWLDVARFRDAGDTGQGSSLEEDLRLRDFTVNAIAYDPLTDTWADPLDGRGALAAGELHACNPHSCVDDPLRILRGVRFAATHNLKIMPATLTAMQLGVAGLGAVAMERVQVEWLKLLTPDGAAARVQLLNELGVLAVLLPEVVACQGVTQSRPHTEDVYGHQLLVLTALEELLPWRDPVDEVWHTDGLGRYRQLLNDYLQVEVALEQPRWLLLKHTALLHDIGKPPTRTVGDDGRIHFYDHDIVGAEMVGRLMTRWKFAAKSADYVRDVVLWHMRPLLISNHLPPRSRTIYRYYRDARTVGVDVGLHSIADQRGKAGATDRAEVLAIVQSLWAAYVDEPDRYVKITPLLNGHEVMELTGAQGRRIGELLEGLKEQQALGEITTRAQAEAWLLQARP